MIYKEGLIDKLRSSTGLAYLNGPRTEIITRCPWCESDSRKSHGHLYIDVHEPIFYCQKCEEAGIFTKLCHQLDINVKDFLDDAILTWKPKTHKVDLFKEDDVDLVIDQKIKKISPIKTAYVDGRIDGRINQHNAPGLIWDVVEFINKNEIRLDDWILKKIEDMNDKFIGFLTNKGTRIVMRNCDSSSDFRYFNLALNKTPKFFKDFYGFRVKETSKDDNTIVLTEGPFDLLVAIGCDCFDSLRQQSIYWVASLGKGRYVSTLLSVLNECKLVRANVVVLADRDTDEQFFHKKLRVLPFIDRLDIYWNRFGNDFGNLPIEPLKVPILLKGNNYAEFTPFTQNSQTISPNEAQRKLRGF